VLVAIAVFAYDFVFVVCGGYGCEGEGDLIILFANHVFLVCLLRCELRRHHEQHPPPGSIFISSYFFVEI
jgi:hypothetical protein